MTENRVVSSEGVELITFESVVTGRGSWQPVEGQELSDLFERLISGGELPRSEVDKIRSETMRLMSRCIDPNGDQATSNTGLVIGRIQSGKTLSFTSATAAARDNGFDLVIVMGGTTDILIGQTRERLARDLGLEEGGIFLRWNIYESMLTAPDKDHLRASLGSGTGARRTTVLITCMKHHAHINGLSDALEGLDLTGVTALIVDDEADQHSLNTAISTNRESTTYRAITRLRSLLPRHTFLQYTATPQAPLLVDLADVLSPDWTALLTPGSGYVGGATYFRERPNELVRRIPEHEASAVEEGAVDPPNSMIKAFYTFLLSFASGHPAYHDEHDQDRVMTRSMMVHPHTRLWTHELVMGWLRENLSRIRALLEADPDSPEFSELVDDFGDAYEDLSTTAENLPPLDELINRLRIEIGGLKLQEVNGEQEALRQALRWNQAYGWILVGGELLNRGFTVKGLTVTYMPRGEGAGNADTLAQRARFYGYRSDYLDHCRVYLRGSLVDAYTNLVDTEERVRQDLENHMRADGSLKSWKRRFLIDPALRPTRQSVVAVGLVRARFGEWFDQEFTSMSTQDAAANRELAEAYQSRLNLEPIPHDEDWGERQEHLRATVPLAEIQTDLLVDWRAVAGDRDDYEAALFAISEILAEDEEASAEVVVIDNARPRTRRATEVDNEGNPKISLMQGRSRDEARLDYPGDRDLPRDESAQVTVQIHRVNVEYPASNDVEGPQNEDDLPLLAVRFRDGVGTWLAQRA